jgi:hypothetical protein
MGFSLNSFIFSLLVLSAPIGNPPPKPFP